MSADRVGEPKYVVSGRIYAKAGGDTLAEAFRAYRELHHTLPDDWERTDADEGGGVIGACESCDRVILDDEKYGVDPEGIHVCADCLGPVLAPTDTPENEQ